MATISGTRQTFTVTLQGYKATATAEENLTTAKAAVEAAHTDALTNGNLVTKDTSVKASAEAIKIATDFANWYASINSAATSNGAALTITAGTPNDADGTLPVTATLSITGTTNTETFNWTISGFLTTVQEKSANDTKVANAVTALEAAAFTTNQTTVLPSTVTYATLEALKNGLATGSENLTIADVTLNVSADGYTADNNAGTLKVTLTVNAGSGTSAATQKSAVITVTGFSTTANQDAEAKAANDTKVANAVTALEAAAFTTNQTTVLPSTVTYATLETLKTGLATGSENLTITDVTLDVSSTGYTADDNAGTLKVTLTVNAGSGTSASTQKTAVITVTGFKKTSQAIVDAYASLSSASLVTTLTTQLPSKTTTLTSSQVTGLPSLASGLSWELVEISAKNNVKGELTSNWVITGNSLTAGSSTKVYFKVTDGTVSEVSTASDVNQTTTNVVTGFENSVDYFHNWLANYKFDTKTTADSLSRGYFVSFAKLFDPASSPNISSIIWAELANTVTTTGATLNSMTGLAALLNGLKTSDTEAIEYTILEGLQFDTVATQTKPITQAQLENKTNRFEVTINENKFISTLTFTVKATDTSIDLTSNSNSVNTKTFEFGAFTPLFLNGVHSNVVSGESSNIKVIGFDNFSTFTLWQEFLQTAITESGISDTNRYPNYLLYFADALGQKINQIQSYANTSAIQFVVPYTDWSTAFSSGTTLKNVAMNAETLIIGGALSETKGLPATISPSYSTTNSQYYYNGQWIPFLQTSGKLLTNTVTVPLTGATNSETYTFTSGTIGAVVRFLLEAKFTNNAMYLESSSNS